MRVLATAVAVLLWPALACADSLGSAARKQAERRQKAPAPQAKVYGEGDIAARSEASAGEAAPGPEPAATVAGGATGAAGATTPSEDPIRLDLEREERARRQQESYWRQAAAAARARVADAQQGYDYVCAGGTRLTGG